jgi:ComF family protein
MRALLDLLLPPHCPGCGREGAVLCDRCSLPLRRRLREPPGAPLGLPAALPDGLVQLEWCATYSGAVRDALHALKYRGERRLREPLGEALAQRWRHAGRGGDLITWVPVHPSRRRDRGFDQAEELARQMAMEMGVPVRGCLERRQRTAAQHSLGEADRADNTAGVFGVTATATSVINDRWIVVVDDIVTTGATLSGCADALLQDGAMAVSAVTVARDR